MNRRRNDEMLDTLALRATWVLIPLLVAAAVWIIHLVQMMAHHS